MSRRRKPIKVKEKMSKIVFIASSLSYGGAEKMLCFVANGFAENQEHVSVINLMERSDDVGRLRKDVEVTDIKTTRIRFLNRIEQIVKLTASIRKIKPDIIISFKFRPNFLASIVGKALGIPVIISERSDPSRECVLKGREKLYWDVINAADGGVFQTTGAMKMYSEKMQKRGTVIPNPALISESIMHTVKENTDSGSVVSVGRLANIQKRYDIMLAAFLQFHRKNHHYVLKIYGNGEDEEQIRTWITENHLEENVFLMGRTNDPLQAMDSADIFLTTSDYEGISNSLLEAMAIGMPVVATDCSPGGARMLIRNGENGLLVPCGDAEMTADALDRMAGDYQLRQRCGEQARKVKEEYSKERIMDLWTSYVCHVIQAYKQGHSLKR